MKIILDKQENIETMIFDIRGKKVMLDSDLAKLYSVETKRINEAVKNNPNKFPERFSWILTEEEAEIFSRSKFSTLNKSGNNRGFNIKYLPRVFTEQGVAMLATILKSKTAVEVSIRIMDSFVAMRRYISEDLLVQKYYNELTIKHDGEIKRLQESLDKMIQKKNTNDIFFSGQIYDSYSKILDIFKETKEELIIVDSYADKVLLDIIKELIVRVTIVTKSNSLLKKTLVNKYNEQYHNLKVIYNDTFHDRYFIIDKKVLYHCGASINRIGYKTFSINIITDNIVKNNFIYEIDKIIKEE